MSLPLTPQRLAATYECLRAFPPFSRWGLPEAEAVKFKVSRHHDRFAHYTRIKARHHIVVSARFNGHFNTLASTMAHEMIHLKQGVAKTETHGAQHNAEFHRLANQVCRKFGWDPKSFA